MGGRSLVKYFKKIKLSGISTQPVTNPPIKTPVQETGVKLSDLNFNKGTARLKSGETFTGDVVQELKNGNKVSITYKDGKIQKSVIKDSNGKIVTEKDYNYGEQGNLKEVFVDKNGVKSSAEFKRNNNGFLEESKVKTGDKTITVRTKQDVRDSLYGYGEAENNLYTTGLREKMPSRTTEIGNERCYPSALIKDVEDAAGNHTITRNFENGMKDVLNLDKKGATGTIKHFDEKGNLVSSIERKYQGTSNNYYTTTESYFGGGTYEAGHDVIHHNFKDIVRNADGIEIATRNNYIDASKTYGW